MHPDLFRDSEAKEACRALCGLEADIVDVPLELQDKHRFWKVVNERKLLRFDPSWAREVHDSASCFLALLRLGTVSDLSGFRHLVQCDHASMQEMLARGYITHSGLCNERFQVRLKEIAARVAEREGLKIRPPEGLVAAKKLKRLMEKTREAVEERGDMQWPGLSAKYVSFSHCFYILDTVRISFTCGGATLLDEVACCMTLLEELRQCTVEDDGLCILRTKSGFASGASATGGYADVKLLCFADLGTVPAFDGTEIPLKIVGEVQLILEGYMKVKARMHLAYEVDRGSFDRKH